jgi:hypothetical protein
MNDGYWRGAGLVFLERCDLVAGCEGGASGHSCSGGGAREQIALGVADAEIAQALQLVERLDALTHHQGAELGAHADDVAHDDLPRLAVVDVAGEGHVELDHGGREIRHALQVRVAGAEVVDDQVRARASAQLFEDTHAQLEVLERRGLRDLQVHGTVVKADRVVGLHEPAGAQLMGVDVDEQLVVPARAKRDVADGSSQPSAGALTDGGLEEARRRRVPRVLAADQRLEREHAAVAQIDDGLKDDRERLRRETTHPLGVGSLNSLRRAISHHA